MRAFCRVYHASLLFLIVAGTTAPALAQERYVGGVGITVFTNRYFQGRSATYREDVSNLRDSGMNDRIFSLRVAPGETWEVCEDKDYRGRCVVVSGDEPDLARIGWSQLISSMRRVRGAHPPRPDRPEGGRYIVLFDRTNYRGTPVNYDGPVPNLGAFSRRVSSVTIGRGVWELCEGPNFSGRCVTLEQSVPDLGAYGLRNRVSSVRPARYGPPRPEPPQGGNWYIVLFDQINYRGTPVNYNGPVPSLGAFGRRVSSVTIGAGVWELCEGPNFSGRCVTLDQSVPDLGAYGLRSRVSSVRPARPEPR